MTHDRIHNSVALLLFRLSILVVKIRSIVLFSWFFNVLLLCFKDLNYVKTKHTEYQNLEFVESTDRFIEKFLSLVFSGSF